MHSLTLFGFTMNAVYRKSCSVGSPATPQRQVPVKVKWAAVSRGPIPFRGAVLHHLLTNMLHHRVVLVLRAEENELGVLLRAHRVAGRPVEEVAGDNLCPPSRHRN